MSIPRVDTPGRGNIRRQSTTKATISASTRKCLNLFRLRVVFRWFALCAAMILSLSTQAVTALTNGGNTDGTLAAGATDSYTLAAGAGDRVVLEIAKLSGGAGFSPIIGLFAPDGTKLMSESDHIVARLDAQAPVTGVYTVQVGDLSGTGSGNYRVRLAQVPGAFVVPSGDDGGALTNGAVHQGTIDLGDLDLWTVVAGQGDRITLQISKLTGGAGFAPMIELFAPDGRRLAVESDEVAARIDAQATSAGTYTVLVSDFNRTGSGTYQLELAHVPGSFVVSSGDEGGTLPDGTDTDGVIALGDLDLWSFSASPGDDIKVQITELSGGANFTPKLELFAPDGTGKGATQGNSTTALDVAIESSGTYTLLVSDANRTGSGSYRLHLTRSSIAPPEPNILTNGWMSSGNVAAVGQTNLWTFTATAGESFIVRMGKTSAGAFVPWLRLYSPEGVLLDQDFNSAVAEVTARATNSGTFLAVVSDGSVGRSQTGSYRISLAKTGSQLVISPTDEGGPLVNGTTYLGTIDTGDVDAWTFIANAGESIVVRMGETSANNSFVPWLRLYSPEGVPLGQDYNSAAAEVTIRATNSGTFLVVVTDGSVGRGGSGNYRLSLAMTESQPAISGTDEGGPLVNGTTYSGTIDTGDIDAWTFIANAGESIVVRMGETTVNNSFEPWLRLYSPEGVLLSQNVNAAAAEVTARATNSGTFLVVVADGSVGRGGSGNYRLSLAMTGSQPVISGTDEGGPLVNGTTYLGTIDTGDIDVWTFTARAGESIVVRMGETTVNNSFEPWLRLYSPEGALLDQNFNAAVAEVTVRATNNGRFLVVVADGSVGLGGAGNYRISLAKTGSPLVISANDEGGSMTAAGSYDGFIDTGDIDAWTFTACAGDYISLNVAELVSGSSLTPWLRLYGKDGVLLKTVFSATSTGFSNFVAPAGGTYLVVVSDGSVGLSGTGTYRLTVNGLSDGLKVCAPVISGSNATVAGIGGVPGGPFVLLTSTEVSTPLSLWSPIRTNQFDQFGFMSVTNLFNLSDPQRFFTLKVP